MSKVPAQRVRLSSAFKLPRPIGRLVLVRHGATLWSSDGRHTGRTDIDLNDEGRAQAKDLATTFGLERFDLVLCSPLRRALETCRRAGLSEHPIVLDELAEWDYGDYEGLRTADIRARRPGWELFRDGCPHGESVRDVAARADRVLDYMGLAPDAHGSAIVIAHGHLLRVLVARYLTLEAVQGRHFVLDPAHWAELGFERETRVLKMWNRI